MLTLLRALRLHYALCDEQNVCALTKVGTVLKPSAQCQLKMTELAEQWLPLSGKLIPYDTIKFRKYTPGKF